METTGRLGRNICGTMLSMLDFKNTKWLYSHKFDAEITNEGWIHDQDNHKVIRESGKEDVLVADEKGYNVVEWTTNTEINNSHFILERSSDGVNWTEIEIIDGYGNSRETNTYRHKDLSSKSYINYYRLSQVDYDGNSQEIDVIKINNNPESKEIYKIINQLGQEVDSNYNGLKIIMYTDGTSEKKIGR